MVTMANNRTAAERRAIVGVRVPWRSPVLRPATLASGRLFVGSWGGKVCSLDAASGCVHWFFDAGTGVRSAVKIAEVGSRHVAIFGDMAANVFAPA